MRVRFHIIFSVLLLASLAHAEPKISVVKCELVSQKRVSKNRFEYVYRVTASNNGTPAVRVFAQMINVPRGVTMVKDGVHFDRIEYGERITSQEMLVLQHHPQLAVYEDAFQWKTSYENAEFNGRFIAPANTKVMSLLKDYGETTPIEKSAIDTTSERRVLRTQLEITITPDARVGDLQPALDSIEARVRGMIKGNPLLVIRFPDAKSLAQLERLRKAMGATPGVEKAAFSYVPAYVK